MVGPAGQHDAPFSGFPQPGQNLLALVLHVLPGAGKLLPAGADRRLHFPGRQFGELLQQGIRHGALIPEGQERIAQLCLPVSEFLHIVLDILGIGGDNGAVIMIVGPLHLVPLVKQGGVEHEIHVLPDQPCYMAVGKLGGIAFGFAGDGLNAKLVNLAAGAGGENHPVSQLGEKGMPERIILIHIQHSGNAYGASGGIVRLQRGIGEEPFQLVVEQIGHIMGVLLAADAPFAAVAGHELAAAGELVYRESAAVGAASALCHAGLVFQGAELFVGEHGGFVAFLVALSGDEGSAEGAHDACNIGADGLAACDLFKAPQHRVVIEGAALHHDLAAQLGGVGNLDDLEEGVFDHGIGQPRRDVGDAGPLLLGLLHSGIHEHGAAGAQIDGMLCKDGGLCEIFYTVVERLGKGFDEGAAAGGAGLV